MIGLIIERFRVWSAAILPVLGFLVGLFIQIALGTRHSRQFEGLVIHLITMIMMLFIAGYTFSNQEARDSTEKILYMGVSYLFVLGVVLGMISEVVVATSRCIR